MRKEIIEILLKESKKLQKLANSENMTLQMLRKAIDFKTDLLQNMIKENDIFTFIEAAIKDLDLDKLKEKWMEKQKEKCKVCEKIDCEIRVSGLDFGDNNFCEDFKMKPEDSN